MTFSPSEHALHSAAPDLLAALKRIVDCYDVHEDCVRSGDLDAARAAIAKATT